MDRRIASLLALTLSVAAVPADAAVLAVAISPDIPPYVMEGAASGMEVDVVRGALPGYSLRFVQMPFDEIETAIQRRRADAAASVRGTGRGVHYSNEFVRFANYAISRKADGLEIDSVAGLKGHRVLTWQGAYLVLGSAFERQYAPGAPERANYVEIADQEEQVRAFWQRPGSVAVIDRAIFAHFSKAMGHSIGEVALHALFPPVTGFKVGFGDAAVRDAFDRGLAGLCRSGRYAALLVRYDIGPDQTVCKR